MKARGQRLGPILRYNGRRFLNVSRCDCATTDNRILSPARLPSFWHWSDVELTQFSEILEGFTMPHSVDRIVAVLG
jgi:hypothetical protein